jgi:adenosylcobinamide hydrolase
MFEVAIEDGIGSLSCRDARWLGTGVVGGFSTADRAANLTVPTGFDRTDLSDYVTQRCEAAEVDSVGPALLTAVDQYHARGARDGSVTVLATAGLSNPAALPVDDPGRAAEGGPATDRSPPPGTVNLLVGTTRALGDGGLTSLLATAVEAKTGTLQSLTGFTGTTSDAVAVGSNSAGNPAAFAGSSTDLGQSTRACVREAIRASLQSYYAERELPASVADAEYGSVTAGRATAFEP